MLFNFVRDFWNLLLTLRWAWLNCCSLCHTPQFCRHSYPLVGFSTRYWIIVILRYVRHCIPPLCGVRYVIVYPTVWCTLCHCIPHCVVYVMSRAYNNGQSSDISGQLWHLTDQTKFDQTNLLYIINGEVNECNRKTNVRTIFNPYHKHCMSLYTPLCGVRYVICTPLSGFVSL